MNRKANGLLYRNRNVMGAVYSLREGDQVSLITPATNEWSGVVIKGWDGKATVVKGKGGEHRLIVEGGNAAFVPARLKHPKPEHVFTIMRVLKYYQNDGYNQRNGEFQEDGHVLFRLSFDKDGFETDLEFSQLGDREAKARLGQIGIDLDDDKPFPIVDKMHSRLERKSIDRLGTLFAGYVRHHGRRGKNNVDCTLDVRRWSDVKHLLASIKKNHVGGKDRMNVGLPYMTAQLFRLYPERLHPKKGRSWGSFSKDVAPISTWLSDFKPGGKPGPRLASSTQPHRKETMSNFREAVIRLAHNNPEMRPHLVPLLRKQAAAPKNKFPRKGLKGLLDDIRVVILQEGSSSSSSADAKVEKVLIAHAKRVGFRFRDTKALAEDILYASKTEIKWDTPKVQGLLDHHVIDDS